jgi:hypothetical protein
MLRTMSFRRSDNGDEQVPRPLEITAPIDVTPAPDALEYGDEPRPARRWLLGTVALGVVVASLLVAVVIPHQRAVQQRRDRVSYDRLLSLTAAGEASVEQAVSHTRDVVQYAEPLLNSPLTSQAVRSELYRQISSAALQSRAGIEAERQRLADDRVIGRAPRLRAARAATLTYLADWSALFGQAGGAASGPGGDSNAERLAARAALVNAAPDAVRAARADSVMGSVGR